MLKMLLM